MLASVKTSARRKALVAVRKASARTFFSVVIEDLIYLVESGTNPGVMHSGSDKAHARGSASYLHYRWPKSSQVLDIHDLAQVPPALRWYLS